MTFTELERAYLDRQRLGRLASVQPDGTLRVSPVGFRHHLDTRTIDIVGYHLAASRKFRNIADNGQSPLPSTTSPPWTLASAVPRDPRSRRGNPPRRPSVRRAPP